MGVPFNESCHPTTYAVYDFEQNIITINKSRISTEYSKQCGLDVLYLKAQYRNDMVVNQQCSFNQTQHPAISVVSSKAVSENTFGQDRRNPVSKDEYIYIKIALCQADQSIT